MPPDAGAGAPDGRGGWRIQFWALQVLELGVAFLLVTQSIHVGRGGVLVAAGVVFALLALTADGPLGILRIVGQRLHVLLVAGVALGVGALSLVPRFRPDIEGLLVVAAAVGAVVVLATRTMTDPSRRGRRARRAGRGPVIDATATVVPPDGATGTARGGADDGGDEGGDSALRRAGRTTGAAAAVGRKAVEEHRPMVEDQVKRTLRGAGRLAGRLAGPKSPPGDPPA
jgi:hypothetical protein